MATKARTDGKVSASAPSAPGQTVNRLFLRGRKLTIICWQRVCNLWLGRKQQETFSCSGM